MKYTSLTCFLWIATVALAAAQPWDDEAFLFSISSLSGFRKADCSRCAHNFEMLAEDQQGQTWFIKHVPSSENFAWSFLFSHWI
ncbi:MAG TPA: hypothetical protein PLV25_06505, partial [Opitutales bacterium]|nr:hypothetical protein [Opitutales bacterium]